MDDQSKALIEQMLAEEEYYFGAGSNSLPHDDYYTPKPKKRKVSKRETKVADNDYQRAGSHDSYGNVYFVNSFKNVNCATNSNYIVR
jgi:hypothetical protein